MATATVAGDDHKSDDLELLSSGNFSDVEVICGDCSWKCHLAILVPRNPWFRKALTGPFKEAKTRQITLVELDPEFVDLVLKYIYGGGLDIMNIVAKANFVVHCVSLWRTADFLMVKGLKASVESAVRDYCDKRMKELCISPFQPTWRHSKQSKKLSPWALDLVEGLQQAYKWWISELKAVIMEFIWVARSRTLEHGIASVLFNSLKDSPSFIDDLLGGAVCQSWRDTSVWIPPLDKVSSKRSHNYCLRCSKAISWGDDFWKSEGQIINAFRRDSENRYQGGWCSDCGAGDNIPWRMERPQRGASQAASVVQPRIRGQRP